MLGPAKANTVAAVETLARSDRRIAATTSQWDADPWLLNTPGGVIDLRTGERRPNGPGDYMTKITAVAPGTTCPRFIEFLATIFNCDADLMDYIQRVFGYVITGVTREQALFFLHGTGANGKSVLLSTVSGILGSYHKTASAETFTASGSSHPTELAGLMGARLVTAVETEEGRRWAESKIKYLTGGDEISARFMRKDFFEFTPVFKLVIASNHKPGLRSVDEAIRRRFHLVPFTITIPPSDRDKDLTNKLRSEWPGILHWMIEGCLKWQAESLHPPATVLDATGGYFEAENSIAASIEERCEVSAGYWENSRNLFGSWKAWAELACEHIGSQKRLSQRLEARGFSRRADGHANRRGFEGIRVRPEPQFWEKLNG